MVKNILSLFNNKYTQKINLLLNKANLKSFILFSIFLFFFWIIAINISNYYGINLITFEGLENADENDSKNEIVVDGKVYVLKDSLKQTDTKKKTKKDAEEKTQMDETDVMTEPNEETPKN